jgi:hypothetical protein
VFVALIAADKLAKEIGFTPAQRLFISYLIAATTYGGHTEEGKRLRIPQIEVDDFFGIAIRLCDVAPAYSTTESARRDNGVNIAEIPATGIKPASLEKQLASKHNFLDYIEQLMDKMDRVAGCELTEALHWRQRVQRERDDLAGRDPLRKVMMETIFGSFRAIAEQ